MLPNGPPRTEVLFSGLRRLSVISSAMRYPSVGHTPVPRVSEFPRAPRPSAAGSIVPPVFVAPGRPVARGRYIPRTLYMAGIRRPTAPSPLTGLFFGSGNSTQIVYGNLRLRR